MSTMPRVERDDTLAIPKEASGRVFYVGGGVDINDGRSPETSFATISRAILAAATGDSIHIRAGTYDENGLDLNVDGVSLYAGTGVSIIDTAGGAQTFLISANDCYLHGEFQGIRIAQAGQVGIRITGDRNQIGGIRADSSTVAFLIAGSCNALVYCGTRAYTATAFEITGPDNYLESAEAIGMQGGTRGIYLSAATAKRNVIHNCASVANDIAGYEVVTGCTANCFRGCSSGANDGPRVDADQVNTWPGYTFDDILSKFLTLDGSASQNLYQVVGIVLVEFISARVLVAIAADTTGASLDLFPTGGVAIPITKAAPGTDLSGLPPGSFIGKTDAASVTLSKGDATLGFVLDDDGNTQATFQIGQKTGGVDTFIRLTRAGAGNSGQVIFRCKWSPLSPGAYLRVV